MIKNILFDLDGTLLPMDQEKFTRAYFRELAIKLMPLGYDPKELEKAIWTGTAAMVKNDGSVKNEEAFWKSFCNIYGEDVRKDEPIFEEFYRNEFNAAKGACGFNEMAKTAVSELKDMGYRVILATNPIFPSIATENRIHWAGLEPEDFEYFTTYENSCHCKPNPAYYEDILKQFQLNPEETLMVGNDVAEDMIASTLGVQVFLLTDCLINSENEDISKYPQGSFKELLNWIHEQ